MNEFQKRALAYNAYRALRKLAAAQNKQNEPTSPTMAAGEKTNANTDNTPAGLPQRANNWAGKLRGINKVKGDYYRKIPKRSSGKGGCCGR